MEILIKKVYSDFSTAENRQKLLDKIFIQLGKFEIDLIESESSEFQALLILTGGTEKAALEIINNRKDTFAKTILLTHNSYNSLPAALEIAAYLHEQNILAEIIALEADDVSEKLQKSLSENDFLLNKRIGVIGKPSDWLIASSHSAEIVKISWGASLVNIEISRLQKLIEASQITDVELPEEDIIEPCKQDFINSEKIYQALKIIIKEENLQAITLRCFDLVMEMQMTACSALARLNAENIPAGCEGDIASVTGMLWAQKQTGFIPWMANPSRIDKAKSSLILAHCTAPLNYLKNVVYRSHFESGIGIGVQGDLDFAEVTIFRLGGKNLDKIWIAEGKVLRHLKEPDLCRTQIEIVLSPEKLENLLAEPLGNHLLILPGNYSDKLKKQ